MAAELVSLRQYVAMLPQSAGNGFIPPPRSSPGLPSPPAGNSSALSAGPSQSRLSPKPFQVSIRGNHAVFRESILLKENACIALPVAAVMLLQAQVPPNLSVKQHQQSAGQHDRYDTHVIC